MIEAVGLRKMPEGADVRTVVVSDVTLFREGISAGLKRLNKLNVVAALCPSDVVAFLSDNEIDIVILDTSRKRAVGHAWAIRQNFADMHIIAFGVGATEDVLAGAESGVSAFVDESGTIEDINDAALRALRGQSYCSPELTAHLLGHIAQLAHASPQRSDAALTHRESEIATLVQQSLSNKEIAQHLRISPATVKNHVHNILEKLELSRRGAIGTKLSRARIATETGTELSAGQYRETA
jgi:two-component system, NarL family, nitrate/nitrite response regulator NarL